MLPLSKKNRESLKAALISEKGFESLMKRNLERQPWYRGVNTLWLAIDSESRVGVFYNNSGNGPLYYMRIRHRAYPSIPSAMEYLEFEILCMPEVSKARMLHAHARFDLFNDLARRGFFVYEGVILANFPRAGALHYNPVAVPTNPIDDKALKGNVYTVASSWRLPGLFFKHEAPLYPHDLFIQPLHGRE